jgi:steroid 5-alpha reductase family enzyme
LSGGFAAGSFAAGLAVTAVAVVVLFAGTFVVAVRRRKHAIVDVVWGVGFVVVAAVSFAVSAGDGDGGRRLLVLGMTAAWGVRLAVHIGLRTRGHGEDPRYEALLAKAPGSPAQYALTHVYLVQAAVLWFVSLPVQVASYQRRGPGTLAAVGVALWAAGLFFEAVGDWQLTRFRSDPANRTKVLDTGLWRYTRHPNYFGDACVWWGLFLVAADRWPGVLTVGSPLLMTWMLVNVTGKPLLEEGIGRRRAGYAEYVRRTSGFLPLPPKRA